MKYLFRISMKSTYGVNRTGTLYVIKETKEEAIEYVNKHKQNSYAISSVACLGHELSGIMFSKQ